MPWRTFSTRPKTDGPFLLFPGKIRVEVLEPIETKGLTPEDVTELTNRCYSTMRETFFRLSGLVNEPNGSARTHLQ